MFCWIFVKDVYTFNETQPFLMTWACLCSKICCSADGEYSCNVMSDLVLHGLLLAGLLDSTNTNMSGTYMCHAGRYFLSVFKLLPYKNYSNPIKLRI